MQYALSAQPVVPMRAGPSDKEEMISQLVFGETMMILEKQQKWSFVELTSDGYRGWVSGSMIINIDEGLSGKMTDSNPAISGSLFLPVLENRGKFPLFIPAGSSLYEYKPASNSFHIGETAYTCLEEPVFYAGDKLREDISQAVLKFINIPYLWGGKNPFGMDCSGLTQTIMKLFGIKLPRDARQQVEKGMTINFINEAQPGDLAFFDNEEGEIIHTGLIIKNQEIIHASGSVRTDRIDHQGIYNSKLRQYTHRLRVIKNVADHI